MQTEERTMWILEGEFPSGSNRLSEKASAGIHGRNPEHI